MWDGKTNMARPKTREAASIHLTAGHMSSISYTVPMVATEEGYNASLEVHLDEVIVTSSLNDIPLAKAETCRVRVPRSSPLTSSSSSLGSRGSSFSVEMECRARLDIHY
jgi:hypothetical protein